MKTKFLTYPILSILLLSNCNNESSKKAQREVKNNTVVKNDDLVKKPLSWIEERVEKAEAKFTSSEGGKLVWQSIEAHGGLKKWFENGSLSFRFDYMPVGKKAGKKTITTADLWSSRVKLNEVNDEKNTFGWDGNEFWVNRKDTLEYGYNVRFWSLTPYYFLGQPFIFDGDGINFKKIEDQTINGVSYDAVKITYDAKIGDAPDDYYINFYDKETHLLSALKYIVSHSTYFKEGGHSPEKTMILYDYKEINGITLPHRYETFMFDTLNNPSEKITDIVVSEVNFDSTIKNDFFAKPDGSKILE